MRSYRLRAGGGQRQRRCGHRRCRGQRSRQHFRFEAENYNSIFADGAASWQPAMSELGFSGVSYMIAEPPAGGCNTPPTCASMTYDFAVTVPGTYYVHQRILSKNPNEDSLFVGFDGGSAMMMDFLENGIWHWETSPATALADGPHTLDVWYREGGTRVDLLEVSMSPTPPAN